MTTPPRVRDRSPNEPLTYRTIRLSHQELEMLKHDAGIQSVATQSRVTVSVLLRRLAREYLMARYPEVFPSNNGQA